MLSREAKLEIFTMALYIAVFLCMDQEKGFHTAARVLRWYGGQMRNLGTWAWSEGIRAENAYRELIAP